MTDIRVTPGDAASLERAVAAAPQGSIVRLPLGNYELTKTLDIGHIEALVFDDAPVGTISPNRDG